MLATRTLDPPATAVPVGVPSRTGRPPRDHFVDLIRAAAIITIVGLHWLMPVVAVHDGALTAGNALAAPGGWLVTWVSQVMPLVFFAGGAAAAISLDERRRRARANRDDGGGSSRADLNWVADRLNRLATPVLPLAIVWLPLPHLLVATGLPEQPVAMASELVGRLLWFLAAYVGLVVLTPLLLQLDARARWVGVGGLAAGAVAVDTLRFGWFEGAAALGYMNVAFVWGALYLAGIRYGRDGWTGGGRRALAVAVAGLAATAAAVLGGPYPASMIGMPGEPLSNMNPPTAVILGLGAFQLGLLFAARDALTAWAARPPVRAMLGWISPRMMTIYLWHTPALIIVAGVAVLGFGYVTPEPFGPGWREAVPLWLAALTAALAALTAAFGRWELRTSAAPASAGPVATPLAAALGLMALCTLTILGFSPAAGAWPLLAVICLAAGVWLASGRVQELAGWLRAPRPARLEA